MVKIKAKYRKKTTHFGRALVKVMSEIEKSTHFGRALVRVRAKIEKKSNFGTTLVRIKVSNGAKIRNRYNQVPHLTQDTNGKVTNSQKTPQTRAKRSALCQQVTTKHI